MNKYEIFKGLHRRGNPFILGNSWNVQSARLFEKNGYKAIGTSSAAIAISLGYEDGEKIPFEELFFIVKRIIAGVTLPVSVDLESGYGNSIQEVIVNIEKLCEAGVVGINLEDSKQRQLVPANEFSRKVNTIKNHLARNNMNLFINARTDAYVVGAPAAAELTMERIKAYENAGADGIFVPFIKDENEIRNITAGTSLPVNVLWMSYLPSLDSLAEWGVARISLGSLAFRSTYGNFEKAIQKVIVEKSSSSLF